MAAVSGTLTQLPDDYEVEIRALVSELFTTPALMKGLGHMLHTVVTTRTIRITGMLPADSRFTLVCANLWSRNMVRCTPRHHAKFHCLQPALLIPTSGPGPVAAVSGSIAQPPEVEMGTLCWVREGFIKKSGKISRWGRPFKIWIDSPLLLFYYFYS